MRVLRTMLAPVQTCRSPVPAFYCKNGRCHAECGDGSVLRVLSFELDGQPMTPEQFSARFGAAPLPFEDY